MGRPLTGPSEQTISFGLGMVLLTAIYILYPMYTLYGEVLGEGRAKSPVFAEALSGLCALTRRRLSGVLV